MQNNKSNECKTTNVANAKQQKQRMHNNKSSKCKTKVANAKQQKIPNEKQQKQRMQGSIY